MRFYIRVLALSLRHSFTAVNSEFNSPPETPVSDHGVKADVKPKIEAEDDTTTQRYQFRKRSQAPKPEAEPDIKSEDEAEEKRGKGKTKKRKEERPPSAKKRVKRENGDNGIMEAGPPPEPDGPRPSYLLNGFNIFDLSTGDDIFELHPMKHEEAFEGQTSEVERLRKTPVFKRKDLKGPEINTWEYRYDAKGDPSNRSAPGARGTIKASKNLSCTQPGLPFVSIGGPQDVRDTVNDYAMFVQADNGRERGWKIWGRYTRVWTGRPNDGEFLRASDAIQEKVVDVFMNYLSDLTDDPDTWKGFSKVVFADCFIDDQKIQHVRFAGEKTKRKTIRRCLEENRGLDAYYKLYVHSNSMLEELGFCERNRAARLANSPTTIASVTKEE